jgi:signal transduction histidine kinase
VTGAPEGAYRPRVRLHPWTVGPRAVLGDVVLAAALAVTMVVELWKADRPDTVITPLSITVIVLASLPVLIRRQRPLLALVAGMATLYVVMATVDIYQTVPFPTMVAGYSVALVTSRRTTILVGLALVPPVVLAIAVFGHDDVLLQTAEIPKNLAYVAAPLLIGSAQRERRAAHAALVERAETAERTRDEEARRRVGEERLRIARDVHDVVAHAMVAINVQAGVGARLIDRDPELARRHLQDIKRVSGEALQDLRSTLGTLRSPDDDGGSVPVLPTQGLDELDELGASLRSAGVEVELDVDPAASTVSAAVAATTYRIVQEALTNVVRHAHGSRVRVRVARQDDRVVIDVTDDGRGPVPVGAPAPGGSGNGVRGMRERAQAAGGTLEAGPEPGGGWRVHASLPVAAP